MTNELSDETVHKIVRDAVEHEKECICEAFPVSLISMNATDMSIYIEFVATGPKLFHATCPFEFMRA